MNYQLATILFAYLLDLIIGDPQWNWHPVRLIGRLIDKSERILNTANINKKFAGVVLVIFVVGVTVFSACSILILARLIHPALYLLVSTILIYFSLSTKSLALEASQVYSALKNRNIGEARKNLSMIVGRDTGKLKKPQVIRAAVETVAESTMDGIIAPLFYAFLGGPVLVWAYKAINTLDSMVGYRNEKFIDFGMASAKLDGLVNFIPAKITCVLIGISGLLYGKDSLNSFKWGLKYFFRGQENNSVVTEAAMAGALNVQLGGLNFYNSVAVTKPLIGSAGNPLRIRHIQESIELAYLCSFLFLLIGVFFYLQSTPLRLHI